MTLKQKRPAACALLLAAGQGSHMRSMKVWMARLITIRMPPQRAARHSGTKYHHLYPQKTSAPSFSIDCELIRSHTIPPQRSEASLVRPLERERYLIGAIESSSPRKHCSSKKVMWETGGGGKVPVAFPKGAWHHPCGKTKRARPMKQKTDVLQGTLALMVLRTLAVLAPLHGYGIARRIEQISGDLLAVNQGTLYPVLLRLEQEGAIASDWGASENNRRARFYRLTRSGHKLLEAETRGWEQTAAIMARFFDMKAEDFQ